MNWKNRIFALATLTFVMLFTLVPAVAAAAPPPPPDPANFVSVIDNPYFPLEPGTRFIYRGQSEGAPTRDVMIVTSDTRVIQGVTTTVVHHLSYEDRVLIEETFDWYAQDSDGNVWYFGEDTKEFDENGDVISTAGSWEAGVDGARAGILMLANPQVGDRYYQEFYRGEAEDQAKVTQLDASICVEYGCFDNVLVTREWTRLEPGVVELKYYAEGVGFIYGEMVKGGEEFIELVRIR
jgi:hypothetical protein